MGERDSRRRRDSDHEAAAPSESAPRPSCAMAGEFAAVVEGPDFPYPVDSARRRSTTRSPGCVGLRARRMTLEQTGNLKDQTTAAFSRTVLGQSVAAGMSGIFQVYSGGIAIDTLSTRLQAGFSMRDALNGRGAKGGFSPLNLYAGHAVMAKGRFPYLFLSLNGYAQTEKFVVSIRKDGAPLAVRLKAPSEEVACIAASTVCGATMITAIECPKILAQLSGGTHTITSVLRESGLKRLMQGYDACLLREGVFQAALFGSPGIAKRFHDIVVATADSNERPWLHRLVAGRELLVTSFALGLCSGFLTNGPDQLKTRIQNGEFRNLAQAVKWQLGEGGGLRHLYGRAAVFRAFYTGHGVVAVNFMRSKVEALIDKSGL